MSAIGTARFKDSQVFLAYLKGWDLETSKAFVKKVKALLEKEERTLKGLNAFIYSCFCAFFTVRSWASHPYEESEEYKWPSLWENSMARLSTFIEFAEDQGQTINVAKWVKGEYAYLYMGNVRKGFVIPDPEKHLEFTPARDYSSITPAQLRGELNTPSTVARLSMVPVAAEQSLTMSDVRQNINATEDELRRLAVEMDNVKNAKKGKLAELQAQIEAMKADLEARKSKLMAELKEKKKEMQEMKEQLEDQLYLVESQLYNILCYTGEVIAFSRIRTGNPAPITEPIVVHQKLRFLDEDLGRITSLYGLQWDRINLFEDFLKHSPVALETFAPNERCISLVRLSRTGKEIGSSTRFPFSNLLQEYEYYHGQTVGIIIRNGENLYLGWTDEEKVHIEDDLIISKVVTEVVPEKKDRYWSRLDEERHIKEEKANRRKLLDGILSRSFVYNILQGVVDNSDILPLPDGVKLNRQSEHVIYAVADRWLEDNRFGSFNDILDRVNKVVKEGHTVLTVQRLIPERMRNWGSNSYCGERKWENVRGRGERNRTHDCEVKDCTIYPINLVEYDAPIKMVKYIWVDEEGQEHEKISRAIDLEYSLNYREDLSKRRIIEHIDSEPVPHYFVSVEKGDAYWRSKSDRPARANFELYSGEYINLTFLNSVWLEWVITNKKLGGWNIKGTKVIYAQAIIYLNHALDFIRKREVEEKTVIDAVDPTICANDPNWPLRLSEWKMEKGVSNITPYQAKRFATAYNDSKE